MKDKLFYLNLVSVLIVLSLLVILSIVLPSKEEFVEIYWKELPEEVDGNFTLNFYVKSYFKERLDFNVSILVDENLEKSYNLLLELKEKVSLSENIYIPEISSEIKVMISPPFGQASYINYWITRPYTTETSVE